MLSVSSSASSSRLPKSPVPVEDHPHSSPKMDQLLAQLRRSMVELILQGDDVTRQMWQMYSVFEEIFGRQPKPFPTSAFKPLVGDKIKPATSAESLPLPPPDREDEALVPPPPRGPSPSASESHSEGPASVAGAATMPPAISPKSTSSSTHGDFPVGTPSATFDPPKVALTAARSPTNAATTHKASAQKESLNLVEDVTKAPQLSRTTKAQAREQRASGGPRLSSNPLLDTIGALTSNPDSDDSDLDVVYHQLRYRGRHRRTEVRMRAHRSNRHHHHHHHQFPSSDPESVGYAGSNSIDSGYKSLCATPEVSDSLSAPEVRRSASDVSASDSSTTSGRPRSSDECNEDTKAKIKMGTRVIAGKVNGRAARSSRGGPPLSDVNLDHLMYLRQSLRTVERQDYPFRASLPPPGVVRDDISPSALTDDDWTDQSPGGSGRSPRHRRMMLTQQQQQKAAGSAAAISSSLPVSRDPSGDAASSRPDKDFLLSGVEYYDLESISEFPQRAGYVTLLEENTRAARVHVRSGAKSDRSGEPGRRLDPLHKMREPSISSRSLSINQAGSYGPRRNSRGSPKVTTDSKLTEAAIRVLEMIEDFRLEEAMEGGTTYREMASGRGRYRTNISPTSVGPHAFVPRFRKNASMPSSSSGTRPASTGSLIGRQITGEDVISIASSSSSSYTGSAEHHVYEEIMYDIVGDRRVERRPFQPVVPPHEGSRKSRNRLLPLPPSPSLRHGYGPVSEESIIIQRNHHPRASSLYSVFSDVQERRTIDNFPELEWHVTRERRNKLTPDFPA